MKKPVSIFLACAMLFSLCMLVACSDNSANGDEESSAPADSGAVADSGGEDTSGDEAGSGLDQLELITSSDYNSSDMNGQIIAYFIDYVNENSGGQITANCYYGGSFCADTEVADYVMAGDLNLYIGQPAYTMSYWPLAFGLSSAISNENAVDTCNALLYDNEETAAVIQAQGAENNLHALAHTSAGRSVFLCKSEITSMEDCTKYTVGSPINLDLYAEYGMGTVAVEPADMYDSLSRGVCNMVAYSAANILTQKLYEVAVNIGDPRAFFTNQIICINNDVWESLNAETQDFLIEAALATSEYSLGLCADIENELFEDVIPSVGGTYNLFTEEEGKEFNYRSMKSTADVLRSAAENLGCSDEMELVISAWADGLQQDPF